MVCIYSFYLLISITHTTQHNTKVSYTTLIPHYTLGEVVVDAFSVAASLSQVVFSGLEFMRLQQKVDNDQKKEDDRLGI